MMTWDYIAGFFDGEGHISTHARGMMWSIAQGGSRGRRLLEEIHDFLVAEGFTPTLGKGNPIPSGTIWQMWICNRKDIVRLYGYLAHRIHIKKTEMQDVVRYIKMYPARNKGLGRK